MLAAVKRALRKQPVENSEELRLKLQFAAHPPQNSYMWAWLVAAMLLAGAWLVFH